MDTWNYTGGCALGRYEELKAKDKAGTITMAEREALEMAERRRKSSEAAKGLVKKRASKSSTVKPKVSKPKAAKKLPGIKPPKGKVYTEKSLKSTHKARTLRKPLKTIEGHIIKDLKGNIRYE